MISSQCRGRRSCRPAEPEAKRDEGHPVVALLMVPWLVKEGMEGFRSDIRFGIEYGWERVRQDLHELGFRRWPAVCHHHLPAGQAGGTGSLSGRAAVQFNSVCVSVLRHNNSDS
jgi:hypothetical protein